MLDTKSPLITEFLKDHQQFSRLLLEISRLLNQDKISEARQRARELDDLAGPHIAYEEAELYPRLAVLGVRSVSESMLLDQHHEALDAVRKLIGNDEIDESLLQEIKAGVEGALAHAEHCGSLISLMSRLDRDQQAQSLAELQRYREEGRKWTEL
jgi:hypothetical protein